MKEIVIPMLLIVLIGLSACAPQDQVTLLERRTYSLSLDNKRLSREIHDLKAQVAALRKTQEEIGKEDILEIRSRQAVLQNRIEEIRAELLRVNGLVEEMQHTYQSNREKDQAILAALQKDIAQLTKELRLLETRKETSHKPPENEKRVQKSGIDVYQKGLDLIGGKKFHEARKVLQDYIKNFPGGNRVANAHFWIGECEYNLNHYEEAILAYEKVIKGFPKSNKAPAALLKEGMAFFRLGDPESAKIIWKKLLKLYPKSSQAQTAKKQIKLLK